MKEGRWEGGRKEGRKGKEMDKWTSGKQLMPHKFHIAYKSVVEACLRDSPKHAGKEHVGF